MSKRLHALAGLVLFITSSLVSAAPPTTITANGFGTRVSGSSPGFLIQGGKLVGGNLYHSFSTFNVGTGDAANFVAPSSSVGNIFARVTGGPSSIDGTITSSLGISGPLSKANLFFINPEGVMFTSNAQINLGGSFVVSTANYVKFADGTAFYADTNHPINDSGLTSAPISAFGFVNPTTQPSISFTGSTLTAPTGQGIHVLGGDVSLDQGATLLAPSGYVSIFSAAGQGEVPFNLNNPNYSAANNTNFGNVSLTNSSKIAIDGAGGGKIVIRGGQLVVDNSTVSSANSGSVAGGDISVQAVKANVQDYGTIQTSTSGTGSAGNINTQVVKLLTIDGGYIGSVSTAAGNAGSVVVQADSLIIEDTASLDGTGIFSRDIINPGVLSESEGLQGSQGSGGGGASGNSGAITVNVDGNISIFKAGVISSNTYTTGDAGSVIVTSQNGALIIDDSAILAESLGATNSIGSPLGGLGGTAGTIIATVGGEIFITNGGRISSSTYSTGNAGKVVVQGGSLTIASSAEALLQSGIFSLSSSLSTSEVVQTGNGGSVDVSIGGPISITNGGQISTATTTTGNAGSVVVQGGSLTIENSGSNATGIFSSSGSILSELIGQVDHVGNGGSVDVSIGGPISIDGGLISSSTYTYGSAGDVSVQAGTLNIAHLGNDYAGNFVLEIGLGQTGISSGSYAGLFGGGLGGGNAGTILVNVAGNISLTVGGEISCTTYTTGNAGDVSVQAGSLSIDDSGNVGQTGIFSGSSGNGSVAGNGGMVNVKVLGDLTLAGGGEISSSSIESGSSSNAGNVIVSAGSIDTYGSSSTGVSGILSESQQSGEAGSVIVSAVGNLSVTGGAEISTSSLGSGFGGNAGTVLVTAGFAEISNGGQLSSSTSTTGNAGSVNLQCGSLVINGINGGSAQTGIVDGSLSDSVGNGGTIDITTGALTSDNFGTVSANVTGSGAGGSVTIDAGSVELNHGSTITTSSALADAGSIDLTVSNDLILLNGSSIDTTAGAVGGNISLKVGNLLYLLDSKISASAVDYGGNILIDPEFIVLDNSSITAFGGVLSPNIIIDTNYFLETNSFVVLNGTVISVPELDLGGAFVGLPVALEVEEKRLKEKCAISLKHEFSTLTVVGRGGTEPVPEELQFDFGDHYSSTEQPKH